MRLLAGKRSDNRCADIDLAFDMNITVMEVNCLFDDGQSQPCASNTPDI
jgi:hypothetical protein